MSDANSNRTGSQRSGVQEKPRGGVLDEQPPEVQDRWVEVAQALGGVQNTDNSPGFFERAKRAFKKWMNRGGDPKRPPEDEEEAREIFDDSPDTEGEDNQNQGRSALTAETPENVGYSNQEQANPDHVLYSFSEDTRNTEDGRVRTIQEQLGDVLDEDIEVDAFYGEETSSAVREFQEQEEGLDATGDVDNKTMARLRKRFLEKRNSGGSTSALNDGGSTSALNSGGR